MPLVGVSPSRVRIRRSARRLVNDFASHGTGSLLTSGQKGHGARAAEHGHETQVVYLLHQFRQNTVGAGGGDEPLQQLNS